MASHWCSQNKIQWDSITAPTRPAAQREPTSLTSFPTILPFLNYDPVFLPSSSMTWLQGLATCCSSAPTAPPLLCVSLTSTHRLTRLNATTWSPDQEGHHWSSCLTKAVHSAPPTLFPILTFYLFSPFFSTRMQVPEKQGFLSLLFTAVAFDMYYNL